MEYEITFIVKESLDGGYEANCVGYSIFTEGETFDEIKSSIKEAVHCHFEDDQMPKMIRVLFQKEEVIAA